ncbi:hypothetical protein TTHERM_00876940 (macronuclear) [Tetrahymena thermophila SB210]|uniref:Uncharacterized protein n=1 Tax=Tetrahymena thermophila (strain SB210) TaxID=312017 RepID=Q23H48_TETTS|nr:hypothetical protein TTHERM_00876910 [Tetrahymena thermophila SB210]XP_001016044.1 hypothetical protein TTHERM_00876940 [Tetrahymena thermophila SB210]EAR95796.1 hypothetical protein TTHERM_00876910 [Tetrahymena thermophila SB210]EAR95799.1 hypothetical protein TTHERM_00876940 [Tetrahymena thermophila SB210]|eukprot:XP_001016041.1 hypothetical protein TTHERM_00876910 [Tetrahymena thermophila SB210]
MDPIKLHNYAEQRCHTYGCQVSACMREANNPSKCNQLLAVLQECIEKEKKYVLENYKKPQKQ